MSLLDKFKKPFEKKQTRTVAPEQQGQKKAAKKDSAAAGDVEVAKKTAKKTDAKIELKDTSGVAAQVIIKPLQSEKGTDMMAYSKYLFEVTPKATKNEIKKAIRAMYKVDPVQVNVINMRGKAVRFGRVWSKRKNWRKAIVSLKPGDSIEVFDN